MKKLVSERKIKHWQGYGTVDAKVLKKDKNTLVIRVSGSHEYGLDCDKYDTYRVYNWLVKRFCPDKTEMDIKSVDIDDRYERVGNLDVEVCDYTIHFKGDRMWQESADSETIKDIERTYGKKTAMALSKYCEIKDITPTEVVSDLSEDRNGMTAWDKFDVWAKRTMKVDVMGNFDDTYDWTGAAAERKREKEFSKLERKERAKAHSKARNALKRRNRADHALKVVDMSGLDKFQEGSGSNPYDEWFISEWIANELNDCEWAKDVHFRNGDGELPWFDFFTVDGNRFKVTVEHM